jgi:hypothetical protein
VPLKDPDILAWNRALPRRNSGTNQKIKNKTK